MMNDIRRETGLLFVFMTGIYRAWFVLLIRRVDVFKLVPPTFIRST